MRIPVDLLDESDRCTRVLRSINCYGVYHRYKHLYLFMLHMFDACCAAASVKQMAINNIDLLFLCIKCIQKIYQIMQCTRLSLTYFGSCALYILA